MQNNYNLLTSFRKIKDSNRKNKNGSNVIAVKKYMDKGNKKVYVSLAVISSRINKVARVIDSILAQKVKADAIKLFISKEPFLFDEGILEEDIPEDLKILQKQGLIEIIYTKNIGPYRKLIPLLREKRSENCIIVTADDDTIYPEDWLERLLEVSRENPNSIVSFRNRYIEFCDKKKNKISPYKLWPEINKNFYLTKQSKIVEKRIFPTGKGGILYKPSFFNEIVFDDKFLDLCPYNDDIWFKFTSLICGVSNKIVFSDYYYFDFKSVPDESNINLFKINLREKSYNNNDSQIYRTVKYLKEKYGANIVSKLISESKSDFAKKEPPVFLKKLPGEFWGITTFFNPVKYKNKYENYKVFRENSKKQGLKLLAVELVFDDGPFELKDNDADILIQIRGTDKNIMWQKEAMLNVGLDNLPENCDKFAWVDCDIVFSDPKWTKKTSKLLENYNVVQPYSLSVNMPRNENIENIDIKKISFGNTINTKRYGIAFTRKNFNNRNGHPGFAWAARREIFDKIKFYDKLILGSADVIVSDSFYSRIVTVKEGYNFSYTQRDIADWWRECFGLVKGSVYYSKGVIFHLWHGATKNRRYIERGFILKKNDFNPLEDIKKNKFGIWEWIHNEKELAKNVASYFNSRNEDGRFFLRNAFDIFSVLTAGFSFKNVINIFYIKKDRFLGKVGAIIKKINPKFYDYLVLKKPKWAEPLDI